MAGNNGSAYVSSFDLERLRNRVPVSSRLQPRRVASVKRPSMIGSEARGRRPAVVNGAYRIHGSPPPSTTGR